MNIPETLASLFSLSLALNRFLIIHSTAEKLIYDLTTCASKKQRGGIKPCTGSNDGPLSSSCENTRAHRYKCTCVYVVWLSDSR